MVCEDGYVREMNNRNHQLVADGQATAVEYCHTIEEKRFVDIYLVPGEEFQEQLDIVAVPRSTFC